MSFNTPVNDALSLLKDFEILPSTCPVSGEESAQPTATFLSATLSRVGSPTLTAITGNGGNGPQGTRYVNGESPLAEEIKRVPVPILIRTKSDQNGQFATFGGVLIVHGGVQGVYTPVPPEPQILDLQEVPQSIEPSIICAVNFFSIQHAILFGGSVPKGIPYGVATESSTGTRRVLTIDVPPECRTASQAGSATSDAYLLSFLKSLEAALGLANWVLIIWDLALVAGVLRVVLRGPHREPGNDAD